MKHTTSLHLTFLDFASLHFKSPYFKLSFALLYLASLGCNLLHFASLDFTFLFNFGSLYILLLHFAPLWFTFLPLSALDCSGLDLLCLRQKSSQVKRDEDVSSTICLAKETKQCQCRGGKKARLSEPGQVRYIVHVNKHFSWCHLKFGMKFST